MSDETRFAVYLAAVLVEWLAVGAIVLGADRMPKRRLVGLCVVMVVCALAASAVIPFP